MRHYEPSSKSHRSLGFSLVEMAVVLTIIGTVTALGHATPQVTGITGVVQIGAGDDFSCAKKGDNTVWCWGEQLYGRLGNGLTVTANVPTPTQVQNFP